MPSMFYRIKIFISGCVLGIFLGVQAQPQRIEDFTSIDEWLVFASDGVTVTVHHDEGLSGKAIRIDFDFVAGAGYGGIRKAVPIILSENYQFTYYVRANAPRNNFEFKLLDPSGDNVWWMNRRNHTFPNEWRRYTVKKRHLSFAWGPRGGGDPDTVAMIEFVIASSEGGKGSVYIDEFYIEEVEFVNINQLHPIATASSSIHRIGTPQYVLDPDPHRVWRSESRGEEEWLTIDMGATIEFGGLVVDWEEKHYAAVYDVSVSGDGNAWDRVYRVTEGKGDRDYIYIQDGSARYIRLDFMKNDRMNGFGIKHIEIKPVDFSESPNIFFNNIAADFPRGYFPRYVYNEQSYWTLIGVGSDPKEALINEEGMIEVEKESFSLEPFIYLDGNLITWNDVITGQALQNDYLPVPSVYWKHEHINLEVKAFAAGDSGASSMYISYRVTNTSNDNVEGTLYIAVRPFQVSPPWQFLNLDPGAARVERIDYINNVIKVNESKKVIPLTRPRAFGAVEFDAGNIVEYLANGNLPKAISVKDTFGYASGALEYPFILAPGDSTTVYVIVPFYDDHPSEHADVDERTAADLFERKLDETIKFWDTKISSVEFIVPPTAERYINVLKSNLAYILINRDGPAIQPGSRAYERAWIRDGSLTSGALLRMGMTEEVRKYINWYSGFQYDSGKIPCVVDHRGPDPVDEHDSPGQFIYAIMEYYRFTADTAFLTENWDKVVKTVEYIEYLINQRKTDEYKHGDDEMRAFYGLVPESISHEGYSAKPMHSYWDNFFVIKGLKDAVKIAEILGQPDFARRYAATRDEFRENFYASISLAMSNHRIEYIPGCVELGDFDATSTSIGVFPCGETTHIPAGALNATFDRYFDNFNARLDPAYEWGDYTPYEVRVAGTFLFLDRPESTHALLNFFFEDIRPPGWNHWAEVVWKYLRTPRFIGDMPHTWVGSDYINVVRNMFLYDREEEHTVVIAAGIPADWIDSPGGVGVRNLPTYYGNLSYIIKGEDNLVKADISTLNDFKGGKVVIKSPRRSPVKSVRINGKESSNFTSDEVVVDTIPASVIIVH
jgi:hypothetical protein